MPGHGQDERDVERRVVGEIAVGRLAVLAEGLAVVGGVDDGRPVLEDLRSVEEAQELRQGLIGVGDLAVVGAVADSGT